MYIFALKSCKYSRGDKVVYQLVVNDKDEYSNFEKKYGTKQYRSLLLRIGARIENLSKGIRLPSGQIRNIVGVEGGFEIKADSLRVYYLELQNEYFIICTGGLKKNQKKDIDRFRRITKELQKQLKDGRKLEIEE